MSAPKKSARSMKITTKRRSGRKKRPFCGAGLVSLFAASNELPEVEELEALFDRFLLRFDVGYLLVASNLRGVLVGPEPSIAATLTMDELHCAQDEVAAVKVTDNPTSEVIALCRAGQP